MFKRSISQVPQMFSDRRQLEISSIFYAQSVKANIIFFNARPVAKIPWTKKLWIYNFRTNVHKTLKKNNLTKSDFDEFRTCYKTEDRNTRRESKTIDRWKCFKYEALIAGDKTNLDIFWLKDDILEDAGDLRVWTQRPRNASVRLIAGRTTRRRFFAKWTSFFRIAPKYRGGGKPALPQLARFSGYAVCFFDKWTDG